MRRTDLSPRYKKQEEKTWKLARRHGLRVDGPKIEEGEVPPVRIARKLGEDSWSEAVETVVAGTQVGVKSGSFASDDYPAARELSFDEDRDEHAPDLACCGRRRGTSPGGVLYVGREESSTRSSTGPAHGYQPFHRGIEDGDVLIVRLQDGRFAKLLLPRRPGTRTHFTYELLADGGNASRRAEFTKQSWDEEKGILTLVIAGENLERGASTRSRRDALGLARAGRRDLRGRPFRTRRRATHAPRLLIVVKTASAERSSPRQLETGHVPRGVGRAAISKLSSNAGSKEGLVFAARS